MRTSRRARWRAIQFDRGDRARTPYGGTLHFMGLLSDGCVHSSLGHLFALVDAAADAGVPVAIDAFLDGRDTPPRSAQTYVARLEEKLAGRGRQGAIASVSGRFYAMDRDKRWDRTRMAYDILANGDAAHLAPPLRRRWMRRTRAAKTTSSSCRAWSAGSSGVRRRFVLLLQLSPGSRPAINECVRCRYSSLPPWRVRRVRTDKFHAICTLPR